MKKIILAGFILMLTECSQKKVQTKNDFVIANGQMPAIAKDKNNLHVVFGKGDSIMYTSSTDNGNTFTTPVLIKQLPHVYTFAMRGPANSNY